MSDQRNLLIAVVLSMVVVFGWQYLVGVPKMQQEQAKQAQSLQQQKLNPAAAPPPSAAAVGQVAGVPREAALAKSAARAGIDTPEQLDRLSPPAAAKSRSHLSPDPRSGARNRSALAHGLRTSLFRRIRLDRRRGLATDRARREHRMEAHARRQALART